MAEPNRDGYAAAFCQQTGLCLVTKQVQGFGARTDEIQTSRLTGPRKFRVLAEKPIAGMYRIAPRLDRQRNDACAVQIGRNARRPEAERYICMAGVKRLRVVLGVDRHSRNPQVRGGAGDADRDLPAIGDQQTIEHQLSFSVELLPVRRWHCRKNTMVSPHRGMTKHLNTLSWVALVSAEVVVTLCSLHRHASHIEP